MKPHSWASSPQHQDMEVMVLHSASIKDAQAQTKRDPLVHVIPSEQEETESHSQILQQDHRPSAKTQHTDPAGLLSRSLSHLTTLLAWVPHKGSHKGSPQQPAPRSRQHLAGAAGWGAASRPPTPGGGTSPRTYQQHLHDWRCQRGTQGSDSPAEQQAARAAGRPLCWLSKNQ